MKKMQNGVIGAISGCLLLIQIFLDVLVYVVDNLFFLVLFLLVDNFWFLVFFSSFCNFDTANFICWSWSST